jgi:hypothetical protein
MILDETPYTKKDLWWILYKTFYNETPKGDYRKRYYYNKACAFDIEVTSTIINDTKCAFMYIWMLGIDGYCVIGRTWEEFTFCINKIVEYCGLDEKTLLPIYVHNLSYEMQFIKDRFTWDYILALEKRKPIYCRASCGIEFRCSYRLSGYSLAKVGENLHTYKVDKMVGDLDYGKVRHSGTPLTDKELKYCIHDVLVVMAYIQECIEEEGSILNIPSTKTGYVRRYVKRECIGTSKHRNHRYRNMIKNLILTPDEYLQLRMCFAGGYTHASPLHSTVILHDVDSYDYTSSYPATMLSEMFPMSESELVEISERSEFEYNLEHYCCMFDATFYDIESKELFEDYISRSHCRGVSKDCVNNNGRVVKASQLTITITEQDFMIIKRMYTWADMCIANFRRYKKGYLPTEFVEAILKLYEDKTKLKGVKGKEVEYMHAKENLNSSFGMTVTDIIRDEIYYDKEWYTESPDLEEAIKRYNNSMSRFLFYPWGVWITAYARANLWTGIISAGNDYVYSDTDSLKMLNGETHKEYIEQYNNMITHKIKDAMEYHNIPFERTRPKTIDGKSKPIGVWDYEGHYSRFKTLGAKRYMFEENGNINITVAGLGKKIARDYILSSEKDPFEFFSNGMYIPKGYTGKQIHTYIDIPSNGVVRDYLGNLGEFEELSSIYLENADYSLSLGREYADFLYEIGTVTL